MNKKNLLIVIFLALVVSASAQELITTTGHSFSASGVDLDWSIGETIVDTYSSPSSQLTQGFHQTKLNVIGIAEQGNKNTVSIYPTPFSDILTIEVKSYNVNTTCTIYDVAMNKIVESKLTESKKEINLASYTQGVYYVEITNQTEKKIYQIIKTN